MISIQKAKVSVVVPMYKTEKYIERCIDSILNQTYANLEVILVNDGSPDNCGLIADSYQEKDNRVKVIHKKNGGLSDARNAGMKRVTGIFTMFVDCDDWLDINMIKTMVEHSEQFAAEVVQSAFYYAYDDKRYIDHRYVKQANDPICLGNQSLMYELVRNKKVKNFAWGKLYQTAIIQDIPFKKGVLFEDVFWAHQVMHKVETYLILPDPFYHYYQREDSIVATYTAKNLDIIKGLKARHRFIETHYKELTKESYELILITCLIHYNLLLLNRKQDKKGKHRRDIELYIQRHYTELSNAVIDNKRLKVQLYLFHLHPYFNVLFLGIIKGLRKVRVLPRPVGLEKVNM